MINRITLILLIGFYTGCAQNKKLESTESIRLNQIGYYPQAPKVAIVVNSEATEFYLAKPGSDKKLFTGKLGAPVKSEFSDKTTRKADFSSFTKEGTYVLVVAGLGASYPFEIRRNVHDEVAKASVKGFYFQRMSTTLSEKFAGKWHRPFAHPDDKVLVHASAVSEKRPEGTIITSPKGWYDAGDYNKYIVNSGITVGTMLSAYEDFPEYFNNQNLNIPESENTLPDLLDEVLWNLRWMMTMQDSNDGGVYHKLTNANFDKMVMPDKATNPRYVVQKSTAAALDFAAVMAQATRVLKKFNNQLPGLSDSCLSAATQAWQWALKNPAVEFRQNELNKNFDPDITTGAYGDRDLSDEFIWAACELYATTDDAQYIHHTDILPETKVQLPSWSQVRMLGYYSLVRLKKSLPDDPESLPRLEKVIVQFADDLMKDYEDRSFSMVMGASARDYVWGSTAVAANQSVALLQAYYSTSNRKYVDAALTNLDFILGRNGTGYSFVTGYGDKTPMHPHHRLSIADGVVEPVPGLLSGGPNPGKQDGCQYTSSVADEAFVDDDCSYASNEIAINWNAPLVYLTCVIEALQQRSGYAK